MAKKPHADTEAKLTEHGVSMVVNLLNEVMQHMTNTGQRDHPFMQRLRDAVEHLQTGN